MKRKKSKDRQSCPTLKKERKVGRNIKPKFGLFKLGHWTPQIPQIFKGEELHIKWDYWFDPRVVVPQSPARLGPGLGLIEYFFGENLFNYFNF